MPLYQHILKDRYSWTTLVALFCIKGALDNRGENIGYGFAIVFALMMVLFAMSLNRPGRLIYNRYKGKIWGIPGNHEFGSDPVPVANADQPQSLDGLRTEQMQAKVFKLAGGTTAYIDSQGDAHTVGLVGGLINYLTGGNRDREWARMEPDKSWEKLIGFVSTRQTC